MGGDEFIDAILDGRPVDSVEVQALSCLESIRTQFAADDLLCRTTGSIGIATDLGEGLSIDELIRRSDEALYQAKRAGKSQCCTWSQA